MKAISSGVGICKGSVRQDKYLPLFVDTIVVTQYKPAEFGLNGEKLERKSQTSAWW